MTILQLVVAVCCLLVSVAITQCAGASTALGAHNTATSVRGGRLGVKAGASGAEDENTSWHASTSSVSMTGGAELGDDDSGMASDVAGMSDGSLNEDELVFRDSEVQREYDRYTEAGVSPAPARPSAGRDVRNTVSKLLTVERGCHKDARKRRSKVDNQDQQSTEKGGGKSWKIESSKMTKEETTPAGVRATPQKWSSWLSAAANNTARPPQPAPPPPHPSGGSASRTSHVQLRGSASGHNS